MTTYRLMGVLIPTSLARAVDDGTHVIEADTDQPVQRWRTEAATSVRSDPPCRCSHLASLHITDRRGRVVCRSTACGCAELRPKSETRTA